MLIEETEHWRFMLIPKYGRKPYTKIYSKISCPSCGGKSAGGLFMVYEDGDCHRCNNTGEIEVDVTPRAPEPPEIPMSYIEHMKKAHKEYMNSQRKIK